MTAATTKDPFRKKRERMVERQVRARGLQDERVLGALRTVPRHRFLPPELRRNAYEDRAIPLGPGSSISQPYIVAVMSGLALPAERVLEVGTGSGYQAAVLAELVLEVHTIEIDAARAAQAARTLEDLHYRNVWVHQGDGREGWAPAAPYDAILVTAGTPKVPSALSSQLAPGGRLILPLGRADETQILQVLERGEDGTSSRSLFAVRFVPLVSPN